MQTYITTLFSIVCVWKCVWKCLVLCVKFLFSEDRRNMFYHCVATISSTVWSSFSRPYSRNHIHSLYIYTCDGLLCEWGCPHKTHKLCGYSCCNRQPFHREGETQFDQKPFVSRCFHSFCILVVFWITGLSVLRFFNENAFLLMLIAFLRK